MGALEPAFSYSAAAWPLAGMMPLPPEPDDPDFAIPRHALEVSIRDMPESHVLVDATDTLSHKPASPMAVPPLALAGIKGKWRFAVVASLLLHAAVAGFFIASPDEDMLIEGSDDAGVALLGSASEDQVSAGEEFAEATEVTLITMLEARMVETVDAEVVTADQNAEAVETIEAETAETLQPVDEQVAKAIEAEAAETMLETAAERVNAEPVEEVTAQPAEDTTPVAVVTQPIAAAEVVESQSTEVQEQLQPATPAPAEAAEANTPVQPVSELVPELLATDRVEPVNDDNVVQRPAEPSASEVTVTETPEEMSAETVSPVEETETVAAEAEPVNQIFKPAVKAAKAEQRKAAEPAAATKAAQAAERKAAEEKKAAQAKAAVARAEARKAAKAEAGAKAKTAAAAARKAEVAKAAKAAAAGKAKQAKKQASKAGAGGKNQADARKGQAEGEVSGKRASNSKGGKSSSAGNAAVSNYPGKVASKLRRALRYPAEAKRQKLRGEVHVSFTVSSGGGVGSIRVVRSSGSSVLDRAAIETVRRAAPFPPIPDGAGRSNWPFTVPLAFTR